MVLSVVLPFVSVLVGAALTYLLNVRQRRSNHVADTFDGALAAVAKAKARQEFVYRVGPGIPTGHQFTLDDRDDVERELLREGVLSYMRALAEARDAVARCTPYRPSIGRYLNISAADFQRDLGELLTDLRKGPESSWSRAR